MGESNEKAKVIKSTDLYTIKNSIPSISNKYCQNFYMLNKPNKSSGKISPLQCNRTPTPQGFKNSGIIIKTLNTPSDFRLSLNQTLTKTFDYSLTPKQEIRSNFTRYCFYPNYDNSLSSSFNVGKAKVSCSLNKRKLGTRKSQTKIAKKPKLIGKGERLTGWDF